MLQPEQLLIGVAAGLILSTVLRWAPSWRELLAAVLAAGLIDFAIYNQALWAFVGVASRPYGEVPVYPHACPCVTLTFIGILAVLDIARKG
jgi:hypothetical protein